MVWHHQGRNCTLACQMQLCYLAPTAISPLGRIQQHQTDWAGRRMVWEHSPCLHILKVLSSPVLMKSTGESISLIWGQGEQATISKQEKIGCWFHTDEQTLAIGKDSHAVDVVGVAVIDLNTFACHQPPPDTRVIAAREELSAADHSKSPYTVLMTWNARKKGCVVLVDF